jgi:hypothetical protein
MSVHLCPIQFYFAVFNDILVYCSVLRCPICVSIILGSLRASHKISSAIHFFFSLGNLNELLNRIAEASSTILAPIGGLHRFHAGTAAENADNYLREICEEYNM